LVTETKIITSNKIVSNFLRAKNCVFFPVKSVGENMAYSLDIQQPATVDSEFYINIIETKKLNIPADAIMTLSGLRCHLDSQSENSLSKWSTLWVSFKKLIFYVSH